MIMMMIMIRNWLRPKLNMHNKQVEFSAHCRVVSLGPQKKEARSSWRRTMNMDADLVECCWPRAESSWVVETARLSLDQTKATTRAGRNNLRVGQINWQEFNNEIIGAQLRLCRLTLSPSWTGSISSTKTLLDWDETCTRSGQATVLLSRPSSSRLSLWNQAS